MERQKFTKTEKEYLRGIIRNLSLQRWTADEISDYLHNEKKMEISRSTISRILSNIEESAEQWYIELRESRYKYIAMYKERLDSLLSYQKILNDIVTTTKKEGNKIRAIATLQSIESDIFNIFKQLPDIRIEDVKEVKDNNDPLPDPGLDQVWGNTPTQRSIDNAIPIETTINTDNQQVTEEANTSKLSTDTTGETEEDDYVWKP